MQGGTRFTYPGGMEGCVDLVDLIVPRPRVELASFRSRVQRSTNATTKTTRRKLKVAATRPIDASNCISGQAPPRPRWGNSQRSPRLPSWIWGRSGKGVMERTRDGKGREGKINECKGREKGVVIHTVTTYFLDIYSVYTIYLHV